MKYLVIVASLLSAVCGAHPTSARYGIPAAPIVPPTPLEVVSLPQPAPPLVQATPARFFPFGPAHVRRFSHGAPIAFAPTPAFAPAPLRFAPAPAPVAPVAPLLARSPLPAPFAPAPAPFAPAPLLARSPVPAPVLPVAPIPAAPFASVPSSQFHAQDEFGGFSYGFANQNSAKQEVRTPDGVTRGAYSYVDAFGITQLVEYVSDPVHGFRVRATNLPVHATGGVAGPAGPAFVADTAEVVEARAAHQRAYDEAVLRNSVAPVAVVVEPVPAARRKRSTTTTSGYGVPLAPLVPAPAPVVVPAPAPVVVPAPTTVVTIPSPSPAVTLPAPAPLAVAPAPFPVAHRFFAPHPFAPFRVAPQAQVFGAQVVAAPAPFVGGPAPFVAGPAPFVAGPAPFVAGPAPFVAGPAPVVAVQPAPLPAQRNSQYHAQDELGGFSFGYQNDLSSRQESRTPDGVTRGSYSYVDANGLVQHVAYTADPVNGFRVAATNLPVAPVA